MRKLVTTLTVLSMLVLVATAPAPATLGGSCCACLPGDTVKSSLNGAEPLNATLALFCFTDFNAAGTNQTERCDNLWGTIACETHRDPVACSELLAGADIICPSSGAPTAGPWMLTGIVVALAVTGMLAARRRGA